MEVLAIVPPPLEGILMARGFHFALPDQKKAMFVRPAAAVPPSGPVPARPSLGVRIRDAVPDDAVAVAAFLAPFVARKELLPRSLDDLRHLLGHAFVAQCDGRIVGFAAIELYSPKLSELQCLSVDESYRGRGIGRRLVRLCVDRARWHDVIEVMAITAREEVLRACGFDYGLPGPETALFIQTGPRRE
jgi:N-acetylglutamate synthase-like GNAT family acetyltransferase